MARRSITIHVLRHGTRQDFVSDKWISPTGLPKDPPLADAGHTQAKQVAAHLRSRGQRFAHIFSSPFSRCLQTVEPFARTQHAKVKIEPGLGEWFSDWHAPPAAPDPPPPPPRAPRFSESDRLFPGMLDPAWVPLWRHPVRWESQDDIHERLKWTVNAIADYVDAHPTDSNVAHAAGQSDDTLSTTSSTHILLVTHAACQIALGRALLGDRYAEINCGVASFGRFRRDSDARWVMEGNGEVAHLSEGMQYNWQFTE
ncbi:hypothetical protein HDU88_006530 [Geranomyces variabilis]|nr:hypothetical protein HDU88_006530 [Geranomyces variabilis]